MDAKKTIGFIVTALAIGTMGFIGYKVLFKKPAPASAPGNDSPSNPESGNGTSEQKGQNAPPQNSPAPPTVVVPGIPIAVNMSVVAVKNAQTYTGYGKTKRYTAGGTDGNGNINKGKYAGIVKEINRAFNSVRVENYSSPAQEYNVFSPNTNHYDYWMSLNDLAAAK